MDDQAPRCRYCGSQKLRIHERLGEDGFKIGHCQECFRVTDLREVEKAKAD